MTLRTLALPIPSSSKPQGPMQETKLLFGTKHPHSPRLLSTLLTPSAVFTFTPASGPSPPSAKTSPEAARPGPSTECEVQSGRPADPPPVPGPPPPQQSRPQAAAQWLHGWKEDKVARRPRGALTSGCASVEPPRAQLRPRCRLGRRHLTCSFR